MPNHVHGIVVLTGVAGTVGVGAQHAAPLRTTSDPFTPERDAPRITPGPLGAIVRSFKSAVTKEVRSMAGTAVEALWQRNYFEHIVRNAADLERVRRYIDENPSRWDLDRENPVYKRAGAGR